MLSFLKLSIYINFIFCKLVVEFGSIYRYKNALGGWPVVIILLVFYLLVEVLRVSSSIWLSFWTDQSKSKSYKPEFYILIYALLSFGQVCESLMHI